MYVFILMLSMLDKHFSGQHFNTESASHNYCRLLCLMPVTLKVISANSVDPEEQSDLGPHCLPVCKTRFEKVCKNIQQTTKTDDIFRCRFSWRF